MAGTSEPDGVESREPTERPTRLQTFRGWHRESSLWREIYARTVSALIAAFVIFVVALAAGYVTVTRSQIMSVVYILIVLFIFFAPGVVLAPHYERWALGTAFFTKHKYVYEFTLGILFLVYLQLMALIVVALAFILAAVLDR